MTISQCFFNLKILFGVWPHLFILFTCTFCIRMDVRGDDNWDTHDNISKGENIILSRWISNLCSFSCTIPVKKTKLLMFCRWAQHKILLLQCFKNVEPVFEAVWFIVKLKYMSYYCHSVMNDSSQVYYIYWQLLSCDIKITCFPISYQISHQFSKQCKMPLLRKDKSQQKSCKEAVAFWVVTLATLFSIPSYQILFGKRGLPCM